MCLHKWGWLMIDEGGEGVSWFSSGTASALRVSFMAGTWWTPKRSEVRPVWRWPWAQSWPWGTLGMVWRAWGVQCPGVFNKAWATGPFPLMMNECLCHRGEGEKTQLVHFDLLDQCSGEKQAGLVLSGPRLVTCFLSYRLWLEPQRTGIMFLNNHCPQTHTLRDL